MDVHDTAGLIRQHLIDPYTCVRCGGCKEACPSEAISFVNYTFVIDASRCDGAGACMEPCQTGAIESWRLVAQAYTPEDQSNWQALPEQDAALAEDMPCLSREPARHTPRAPASAARPLVNLHSAAYPLAGTVVLNQRLTPAASMSAIHHIVIEYDDKNFKLLEGQSVGVIPPGLDESGHPYFMRLYSVASARDGEGAIPNRLALTVKRVTEDTEGKPHEGICSNYLCNRQPGDIVQLTGPFGTSFLLPNEQAARLLMVCAGTGIASMRGFIERKRLTAAASPHALMLFCGSRTLADLPYGEALHVLAGHQIDLDLSLSRVPGQPKRYVQHALLDRHAEIAALLNSPAGHVYVCGLRGLETGVTEALRKICERNGLDWAEVHEAMLATGRIHFETY